MDANEADRRAQEDALLEKMRYKPAGMSEDQRRAALKAISKKMTEIMVGLSRQIKNDREREGRL